VLEYTQPNAHFLKPCTELSKNGLYRLHDRSLFAKRENRLFC